MPFLHFLYNIGWELTELLTFVGILYLLTQETGVACI